MRLRPVWRCVRASRSVIWPGGRKRDCRRRSDQRQPTTDPATMTRTRHRRRAPSPLARLSTNSLYETCATALNREIETGALRPGQRLPSERSLGDALGFTRLTVRRALQVLAQRGLLEPDERRGWQVRSGQVSDSLSTLMGFTQMARMRGLVASSRILSLEYRDATSTSRKHCGWRPARRCWIFRDCAFSMTGPPRSNACECRRAAYAGRRVSTSPARSTLPWSRKASFHGGGCLRRCRGCDRG